MPYVYEKSIYRGTFCVQDDQIYTTTIDMENTEQEIKIGAGRIQSAVLGTNDYGEEYVDIIAEDGTNYRMYLVDGCSVMEIENLDIGEWPMRSYR